MNSYRKAMFNAYYPTTALFVGVPLFIFGLVDFPLGMLSAIFFWMLFSIPLFVSGYILAPILGPKCKAKKSNGALMAAISLASAVFVVSSFWVFNVTGGVNLMTALGVSLAIFIAGIGPAMFSALLFIGQCEKL